MITLQSLPQEMHGEIGSHMSLETLLNILNAFNNKHPKYIELLINRIKNGALSEKYYDLRDLENLAKEFPFITDNIIAEINRRLNGNMLLPIVLEVIKTLHIKPFFYTALTKNPNIILKDVLNHPEINWRYDLLSENPNITIQDALDNPEISWNYSNFSDNPKITIDDIIKYKDIINWNWRRVSCHENINMIDVFEHPEIPWDYVMLSNNRNITIEYVIRYKNLINWDYDALILAPNITISDIMESRDIISWNLDEISGNLHITMDDILKYKDLIILKPALDEVEKRLGVVAQ